MTVNRELGSRNVDDTSKGMLFEGASVSQLGILFGMDNRNVAAKIADLAPCGRRHGHPIYLIKEAAERLVDVQLDLEQAEHVAAYVRKLNPQNMPKALSKEFWSAMKTRQEYEENAADLWRTEKVIETFSDLVKSVRDPLILAKDQISNEMELTDRQHQIIDSIVDGILESLHDAVVKQFGARAAAPSVDDEDI